MNLVKPEHGQRHQPKDKGNRTDCPDILEVSLQLLSGCSGNRTDHRVGSDRSQHIDDREPRSPTPTGTRLADNRSEQDRDERQNARGETEQQTGAKCSTEVPQERTR